MEINKVRTVENFKEILYKLSTNHLKKSDFFSSYVIFYIAEMAAL